MKEKFAPVLKKDKLKKHIKSLKKSNDLMREGLNLAGLDGMQI